MDKKIDYIVHEGAMVRAERQIRRLTVALILVCVASFATNGACIKAVRKKA